MKTNGNENTLEPQQMILTGSKPSLLAGKRKRTAMVALSESDALKYHRDNAWPEFGSLLTMIAGEKMLAVLAGVPVTQPDVFVSARDFRKTRITNYQKRTTMDSANAVEVASVVPAGVERKIDGVIICNRDSSAVSVSLYVTGTLTTYILDTYSIPSKAVATITPQGISVSALTRHDQLAELTDDDHTQYPLMAGRSGGQTINGSTVAGEELALKGTSNITPGRVVIHRPKIADATANPTALGDLWLNSTAFLFNDGAVRKIAPFKNETPSTASLPVYIASNAQWEALTLAAGKVPIHRGGAIGSYYLTQILTKSGNYTLVTDDYGATVVVTATATITLPAPATVGAGWWVCVKKTAAAGSNVTIARNGSETIDGRSASDILYGQYATATYVTDGTNWHTVNMNDSNPIRSRKGQLEAVFQVNNTTTFANVTGMSFPVNSGEVWNFEFFVPCDQFSTTAGLKWQLTGPANTYLSYWTRVDELGQNNPSSAPNFRTSFSSAWSVNQASSAAAICFIKGGVKPSANGTVQLQFAQQTATVGNCSIYAGAWYSAERVV